MTYLFSLLFILVPLAWLPNTSELFEFNKIIVTYILAGLIMGLWAIRCIREKKIIFRRTLLDFPLLLLLLFTFISLLFSIDQRISWAGYYSRWNGGLQSLIVYALLYWAFVSNMNRKSALFTIYCSLFTAAIVSIYGALEHFGRSISCLLVTPTHSFDVACWIQDVQNRVFATLGQPNWMAAYLMALIWIPISRIFKKEGLLLNTAFSCLFFIALLFTKSRSGLLAFGLSTIVFWAMNFNRKSIKNVLSFSLGTLILLLAFQNPIRDMFIKVDSSPISGSQTGTALETGGTESGNIRKIVWTGAVRVWLGNTKNFLVGTGPETFALSYYQYRPVEHNNTSEWDLLYNKAHNEFLNQLATTGLLGFGVYLIFLISVIVVFIKTRNPEHQTLNTALFAGWVSILVTNFWGFSVVVTQIFLFLFPALSIIINDQESIIKKSKNNIDGKQVLGILGVTLVVGYWSLVVFQYWNNDRLYAKAQNYYRYFASTNQSDYIFSALDFAQRAFLANNEPVMGLDLANYSALVASALSEDNSTVSAQLTKMTKQTINYVSSVSKYNPSSLRSAAKAQITLGDYQGAYTLLKAAEGISPTDPKIPYSLGVVSLSLGKQIEAKQYFERAVLLKPDWPDPQKQLGLLK